MSESKPPREPKAEQVSLRVSRPVRAVLNRAMALTGLSLGDLAYEGARQAIERHERMVLRDADRETFLLAVRSPPKPVAKLKDAFREWAARVSKGDEG